MKNTPITFITVNGNEFTLDTKKALKSGALVPFVRKTGQFYYIDEQYVSVGAGFHILADLGLNHRNESQVALIHLADVGERWSGPHVVECTTAITDVEWQKITGSGYSRFKLVERPF